MVLLSKKATMTDFGERWKWIINRSGGESNIVQERHELEHIYNLMRDCKCGSYLEIGCAEGDSLYVLGSLSPLIHYVDFDEDHTREKRKQVIALMPDHDIYGHHGDSGSRDVVISLENKKFDCVLIDAGHTYQNVMSDAMNYAKLATKYIFFHDIQLPAVKQAIEDFIKNNNLGVSSTFINSDHYGYWIIKCHSPQP